MTSARDGAPVVARGSVQMVALAHGSFTYPARATFGPFTMAEFEFVWVIDGSATCTITGRTSAQSSTLAEGAPRGELVTLTPGRVLLVRPGETAHYAWSAQRATHHGYAHFTADAATAEHQAWPRVRDLPTGGLMAALCQQLTTIAAGPLADSLVELLLRLFLTAEPDPGSPPVNPHLAALADGLVRRWGTRRLDAVAVAELGRLASVSGGHLSRITRDAFGMGPAALVERVRLQRAAGLVARTNLTLALVADLTGFASPFHLSRRFQAVLGASPRDVRGGVEPDMAGPAAPWVRAVLERLG